MIPLQYQQFQVGVICVYSIQNNLKWVEKNVNLVRPLIYQSTLLIHQKQKSLKTKYYQELIKSINHQLNQNLTEKSLKEILQQIAETFEVEQTLILKIVDLQKLCCLRTEYANNGQSLEPANYNQQWQIEQLYSKVETEVNRLKINQSCLQNLCETQQVYSFFDQVKINSNSSTFVDYSLLSLPIFIKGDFLER